MAKIKGIDISYWQGNVNFKKVAADGIKFAVLRDGYRKTLDSRFVEYVKGCQQNGIYVMAYHFIYTDGATPKQNAQSSYDNLKKAGLDPTKTWIAADLEYDTWTKNGEKVETDIRSAFFFFVCCNTCGNIYVFNSGTSSERVGSDGGKAVREGYRFKRHIVRKCVCADRSDPFLNINGSEERHTLESALSDLSESSGDSQRLKTGISERVLADSLNACGDRDRIERRGAFKRLLTDFGNCTRYFKISERGGRKRSVADFRQFFIPLTDGSLIQGHHQHGRIVVGLDHIDHQQFALEGLCQFFGFCQSSPRSFGTIHRNQDFFKHTTTSNAFSFTFLLLL